MNPRLLLDSGVHDVDSGFRVLDSRKWELDSRSQFLQWGSGFQSPEFQIPHDKISWILDSTSKHLPPLVEKTILKCSLIGQAVVHQLTTPENTITYHRISGARVAQWWSTSLPPMWPRFESWRWRHMWVEFVVGSLPCSERFFAGVLQFSSLLKN